MLRIAIVAAEPSGDQLGGHLIRALKQHQQNISFEGIGGDKMIGEGFSSWYPMEKLSVMGLVEVLKHLPELLGIRRDLTRRLIDNPPDLFIGIDAPDFNLGLEKKLKSAGIPTVHYVSPTIWAWREKRVKTLRKATDLVLSIFPFEVPLLKKHGVTAVYAGHPLAEDMKNIPGKTASREMLNMPSTRPVMGILPGSRMSEVKQLTDDFLETALLVSKRNNEVIFSIPVATDAIEAYILSRISSRYRDLDIRLFKDHSRTVMAAADVLLMASGTASLEAALYKKPMVIGYRVHWLTHFILIKLGLVKTRFFAMPNILADSMIVPEHLQESCRPEVLAKSVLAFFTKKQYRQQTIDALGEVKASLSDGSVEQAAQVMMDMVKKQ